MEEANQIQPDSSTVSQPIQESGSKKKYIIIGIIVGVIIIIALLSFFMFREKAEESEVQPETEESIQDILAKAETIDSVQYEVVSTTSMNGVTTTGAMKGWQKTPYMRFDSTTTGTTTKIIYHPDAMYVYDASKDKYSKKILEELAEKVSQKSFEEFSKEIKESETLKELGTETIDGKLTTIVEYSVTVGEAPITLKLWIWNEKGIPLKTESTVEMGEIVTTTKMEYKNFVFEDIPDSIFEVPEDKIIESSA